MPLINPHIIACYFKTCFIILFIMISNQSFANNRKFLLELKYSEKYSVLSEKKEVKEVVLKLLDFVGTYQLDELDKMIAPMRTLEYQDGLMKNGKILHWI